MSAHALKPLPLTRERFQPFGDVIEAAGTRREAMNAARFERFDDLCGVDVGAGGRVSVSIARCRSATQLPYRFDVVSDHWQNIIQLGNRRIEIRVDGDDLVQVDDLEYLPDPLLRTADLHRATLGPVRVEAADENAETVRADPTR